MGKRQIGEEVAAWCNSSPTRQRIRDYFKEFLGPGTRRVSASYPLGLGDHRYLAARTLKRLIAATHSDQDLKRFDIEAALARVRRDSSAKRSPLWYQAVEHFAALAWPTTWDNLETDLNLFDGIESETVRAEAYELIAALRDARTGKVIARVDRVKMDDDEPITKRSTELLGEKFEYIFGVPPSRKPASTKPTEPTTPNPSKPLPSKGHLRRVV